MRAELNRTRVFSKGAKDFASGQSRLKLIRQETSGRHAVMRESSSHPLLQLTVFTEP